ncbi:hypothetical protein Tco_0812442 [Tanacetum coccineum]
MLDKTNYSSWASRMLLYIKGKQHGNLLVDLVLNKHFQYGTIVEPRNENTPATVRPCTYTDLTDEEKIYESVDIKATNIVIQELDSGLVVPYFNPSNDPRASLNKEMAFFSTSFASHYPPTNNQLRISSNPRNQATIQDGRVIMQIVQGRQTQGDANNEARKGHMARQCTKLKRPKNSAWFKEKMLLTEALESGAYLDPKQLDFLADNEDTFTPVQATQEIPSPTAF